MERQGGDLLGRGTCALGLWVEAERSLWRLRHRSRQRDQMGTEWADLGALRTQQGQVSVTGLQAEGEGRGQRARIWLRHVKVPRRKKPWK